MVINLWPFLLLRLNIECCFICTKTVFICVLIRLIIDEAEHMHIRTRASKHIEYSLLPYIARVIIFMICALTVE